MQHFLFRSGSRKVDERGIKTYFFAVLDFPANIGTGCGIVPDQDRCQVGTVLPFAHSVVHLISDFGFPGRGRDFSAQ